MTREYQIPGNIFIVERADHPSSIEYQLTTAQVAVNEILSLSHSVVLDPLVYGAAL